MWNGFEIEEFSFDGCRAIVVKPKENNDLGRWLLKTEYWDAFPALEAEMVRRGWHLAYVENKTRWCAEEDLDRKAAFAAALSEGYGLRKRCVPVGMSCGGMIAVKFAAKYPELVSGLYLDAPVMNLLSCPAGFGVGGNSMLPEFLEATGMSLSELICYREHPMDRIPVLAEHRIPVVLVYGDSDDIVPYCENGLLLERYYREHGVFLRTFRKIGCGHHPHGPEQMDPVAEIIDGWQ